MGWSLIREERGLGDIDTGGDYVLDRIVALRMSMAFSDSFSVIQPKPMRVAFSVVLVVLWIRPLERMMPFSFSCCARDGRGMEG